MNTPLARLLTHPRAARALDACALACVVAACASLVVAWRSFDPASGDFIDALTAGALSASSWGAFTIAIVALGLGLALSIRPLERAPRARAALVIAAQVASSVLVIQHLAAVCSFLSDAALSSLPFTMGLWGDALVLYVMPLLLFSCILVGGLPALRASAALDALFGAGARSSSAAIAVARLGGRR